MVQTTTMTGGGSRNKAWKPWYFVNDYGHPVEIRPSDPLFKIVSATTVFLYGIIGRSRGKTT